MTLYGYRFDRDAAGAFYVKQRAQDGEMIPLPDVAQDHRRFATWQEAQAPADKWAQDANDPRVLPVCNPMYQERRMDGVAAHLEYDPRHGTILVRDRDCKDRAVLDAAHTPRHTAGEPTHTPDEIARSVQAAGEAAAAGDPFPVRMMPGQEPYTPEELARVHAMVADAAAGDPGEADEAAELIPPCPVRSGLDGRPCTLREGHAGYHSIAGGV